MKSDSSYRKNITILSGGVGGSKLARGFAKAFSELRINIISNTADDMESHGLHISPDLDTMMYTLAGISGVKRGWGIEGDTFHSLSQLAKYGEAAWFKLGDRDLATHILRTKMLSDGKTLTQVTSHLARKLGVKAKILPMTNERVETFIKADNRTMPFQVYFVRYRNRVHITKVIFRGIRKAHPTREVAEALSHADLIIFAPSNPIVSILPILSLSGVRQSIMTSPALKVAVSPFIGKEAISGPAKELIESKGFEGSSYGLARFYAGLIDILVIHFLDEKDKKRIEQTAITVVTAQTLMKEVIDSVSLARKIFNIFLKPSR